MDDDLRRAIEMSLQEDPRPADQDAVPTQEQETHQAAPQEPSGIPALPNFGSQSAPAAAVQHVAAWAPVGAAAPLAVRAVPAGVLTSSLTKQTVSFNSKANKHHMSETKHNNSITRSSDID